MSYFRFHNRAFGRGYFLQVQISVDAEKIICFYSIQVSEFGNQIIIAGSLATKPLLLYCSTAIKITARIIRLTLLNNDARSFAIFQTQS